MSESRLSEVIHQRVQGWRTGTAFTNFPPESALNIASLNPLSLTSNGMLGKYTMIQCTDQRMDRWLDALMKLVYGAFSRDKSSIIQLSIILMMPARKHTSIDILKRWSVSWKIRNKHKLAWSMVPLCGSFSDPPQIIKYFPSIDPP